MGDIKGKEDNPVKVAVRIRPSDSEEDDKCLMVSDADQNAIIITEDRVFTYDIVLGEDSQQKSVYEQLVEPLTTKLINGFNCATLGELTFSVLYSVILIYLHFILLAYGQTGTGKTYTMHGMRQEGDSENSQVGIIDRAVDSIFTKLYEKHGENGYKVAVSFIEIYNEKVYDLFSEDNGPIKGHYKPKDIEHVEVASSYEAIELLRLATSGRHTRPTALNANSSRSHAVFTIHVTVKTENQETRSAIHLVDLAGSEGVKRTGHQGAALAEGNHINQGLLAVGKVLQAMSSGLKVIPYRDSVLTQVLQQALNSKSYLSLLSCISPLEKNLNETLSTLRFAQNAKLIKTMPEVNQLVNEMKKAKTPSKYGAPLRSLNPNTNYITPRKRPFSTYDFSTIKKQQQFPNNTICTPSKRQRMEFTGNNQLNSTTIEIPAATALPTVQEFFHPDNFRNAIGVEGRESVVSLQAVNISSSTEIDQPPELATMPRFSGLETPKQSFSPLVQRIANLEKNLEKRLQQLSEALAQNQELMSFAIQNQTKVGNRENNYLDELTIPDNPLTINRCFSQMGMISQRNQTNSTSNNTEQSIPNVIDLCNTHEEESGTPGFKAPELPVVQPIARSSRRKTLVDPNFKPRRSARLSSVPPPLSRVYSPEILRKKSQARKKDVPKVKNAQIANYFKSRESIDPKVAKSKHREAVLDLLNKGSIKELQVI